MKKTTTWAVLGSMVINLMLAFAVAAVFSVTPRAQATVAQASAAPARAICSHTAPREVSPAVHEQGDSYLVAVRMGWGAG
jgi:hypothetical protein